MPGTGELRITDQRLLDEHTTYTLKARVSDGFHTSDEVTLTVATQDLPNVADGAAGGTRARDALARRSAAAPASARSPPAWRKDYEASTSATVISTAGDATLSVADPGASPGRLVNGAFSLAQPVQAAVSGRVRARSAPRR